MVALKKGRLDTGAITAIQTLKIPIEKKGISSNLIAPKYRVFLIVKHNERKMKK